MPDGRTVRTAFVLASVAVATYLVFRVIQPFFSPIAWALLIGTGAWPVNRRLRRLIGGRRALAAFLMTVALVILVVGPVAGLMASLVDDAANLVGRIEDAASSGAMDGWVRRATGVGPLAGLLERLGVEAGDIRDFLLEVARRAADIVLANTTAIVGGAAGVVLDSLLVVLTTFYVWRDGDRMARAVRDALPFAPEDLDLFAGRFEGMVKATVYGGLAIAAVQGTLGGLLFLAVGLPSPVFWGFVMGLLSLVPFAGAPIVWAPAAVVLAIQGEWARAIILAAAGVVVVGLADNLLRPYLMSTRTRVHPIVLFFAVLGGVFAFGSIGIAAGPLVATFALTLGEVYTQKVRRQAAIPSSGAGPVHPADEGQGR